VGPDWVTPVLETKSKSSNPELVLMLEELDIGCIIGLLENAGDPELDVVFPPEDENIL
jgi:hypothetical protein